MPVPVNCYEMLLSAPTSTSALNSYTTSAPADAAEVMEYLTAVLRGESKASVVVVESVGDGCSEARTITKPPDERERLKAAELLGKRFGLFTDKVNVSGSGVVQIVDDIPDG